MLRRALALCVNFAAAAHGAEFATFRYDDDFTARRGGGDRYAQLKHIDAGSAARYLSIGGDLRERAEYYSDTNIGANAYEDDALLLHRLLLHADLHWDRWRLFAQLGNHDEFGREPKAKPTDVDRLDLRQAFVDARIDADAGAIVVRAGRQEMAFGASRLITARDGPNIRLAFDGLRLDMKTRAWHTTAIAVRPAQNDPERFDDGTVDSQTLRGIHATYRFGPGEFVDAQWRADMYYFDSRMDDLRYDSVSGDEHRRTAGWRVYGKRAAWDSDIEFIAQAGDIAHRDIRAFALATDNGWTFDNGWWRPRFGLRTDIISGDRDAGDDVLGTFNALYPNGSYFSEATMLAQANLLDFSLSLTLKPRRDLTLSWAVNPLWRYSTDDALYALPLSPLIAGNRSAARYIGVQNQLLANWQVNDFVAVRAAVVIFNAGDFVQQGGGHDLDYLQFATSFRF